MSEVRRLVLFSGMGADSRLTRPVRVRGVGQEFPEHLEPEAGEDLPRYAARVAERWGIGPADVVGGTSFGGMLAGEISAQRRVAGLVLLGSSIRPERFPRAYGWVERLCRFLPDPLIGVRSFRLLVRRRFAPMTPEGERCLLEMAAACPVSRLRAFGRMIVGWKGVGTPECPILSVHGRLDRIIPPRCAEPGVVLEDAGHAFTLTHAERTCRAVGDFLRLP